MDRVGTARLDFSLPGTCMLYLEGDWSLAGQQPHFPELAKQLPAEGSLGFAVDQLVGWDTSLAIFIGKVQAAAERRGLRCDPSGLPLGICRLLELAQGHEQHELPIAAQPEGLLARVGSGTLQRLGWGKAALGFLGGTTRAAAMLLLGRARWRAADLGHYLHECGPGALPIVSLIALLVGVILAFVGAMQLQTFGVQLYVANLVGIGMARDMGAMMTGIILAGRTGAAYAAQLGSMQVNEEIDALRTLGIDPLEYLVLPRLLALVVMLPLLCCYADLLGILGGGVVCVSLFDITPLQYLQQTRQAVPLHHFAGGLVKATVYGVVVAMAGCHRGLACGRSAAAVGEATTSAVVTAITWIVVWCAILTVVFNLIGV